MARGEDPRKKLGKRVRDLRKRKGLRQVDLDEGEDAVSLTFVQAIERGVANPSLETLYKLARQLGVPLKSLFDFD
ncbi:MAG: helix-turn-helix transcriptional regulator [Leptospirales bacterium]|nr:helix-turn-helix transcriptional regulator [Leptospirales bacterium]